jgi:hypothetical protein
MNSAGLTIADHQAEIALLLCCARTRANLQVSARIECLLREPLDWTKLLSIADTHRVAPLLHSQLCHGYDHVVPAEVLARLRHKFERRVRRNLFLTGELLSQIRLFESHGVESIPWKGPALATSAYGSLSFREFWDLDILVRKQDFRSASRLLRSRGYGSQDHSSPRQEKAYLEVYNEDMFINPETGTAIELHWAIAPKAFSFRFDMDRLWESCVSVGLGGTTVRAMRPEYLLLTLCVHGSKHCWERLSLVCDVSETIEANDRLDWEITMGAAHDSGAERMVLLGLILAHDLLGTDIPEGLRISAVADRHVMKLAREVDFGLFPMRSISEREKRAATLQSAGNLPGCESVNQRSIWRTMQFHLRAKDGLRDRIRYLAGYIAPTSGDWTGAPLPDSLFLLYYVLRPFRLLKKYSAMALRRGAVRGDQ